MTQSHPARSLAHGVAWLRWQIAPLWWSLLGRRSCARYLRAPELERIDEAFRSDRRLRRALTYVAWALPRELRAIVLLAFEARLAAGRAPLTAAGDAIALISRELPAIYLQQPAVLIARAAANNG